MSHQDKVVGKVRYNAEFLKQALHCLLGSVDWSGIQFRKDCTWLPLTLVATALMWAWSDEGTLGDRFFAARRIIEHLYRPQQELAGSVQAFMKMLLRWTGASRVSTADAGGAGRPLARAWLRLVCRRRQPRGLAANPFA